VALLAAVDDPRDSIQLATALRSPLFGLSDQCLLEIGLRIHAGQGASLAAVFAGPEPDLPWLSVDREQAEWAWSVIRELRSLRAHLGVPAMVERALELTDYESVMAGLEQGAQRNANLRKVVDLAYRFDSRRFFTLHDFVAYLRRLVETEPYEPQAQILAETDNVVRLMTVHQAKGLEFPVVIVADAGRGPNRDNRAPLLAPDGRLLLHATDGSGADEIPNAAIEEYRHGLSDQEEAESARILYVALTRARDRLIVSEGSGTSGWSKYLRQLVGDAAWQRFAAGDDRALQVDCGATRAVLRKPDCSAPVMAPSGVPGADSDLRWPPAGTESANGSNQGAPVSGGVLGANGRAAAAAAVTSPTALADFDRCPRQYWFRHEIGLPERGAQAVSDTGRGAALGLVAHAVLERVAANGADQTREIDELTERLGRAAGLEGAERAAITRDLARYVTFRPLGEMILGREVPFMLHVGETLFVRGQIDVIARAKDQLIVRDYKYAKSADVPRYQVQMECYALAMTTASRGVKVAAEIVALRDNPAVVEVALPQADAIRGRLGKLGDELAAARRANDFPKKPAKAAACRALGCGYIARCWGNRDAGEQLSLNLPDRY